MTFREKPINKLYAFALAALFALTLAGCGGGGGGTAATPDPEPPPMPTPYEQAVAAIAAAETEEAAQAAYDAVKEDVTAAQGEKLQAAVDARIMAIQTAARVADQKEALSTAAGNIDTSDLSTQEMVDAARTAIAALRGALDDADDVSDEDKATYMTQLNDAVAAVNEAQGGIDTDERRENQMTALSDASTALQAALAALAGSTPTQAQLDAANNALADLNTAIADGADLTDAEKATYVREAANAAAPINTAQMAFDAAEDEDQKAADAAALADARKLFLGIGRAPLLSTGDGARSAAYSGTNDVNITVTMDDAAVGDGTDVTQDLTEDKKATVPANHGWAGKKYTASGTGVDGTYEAYVYSNVGDPTEGDPFNEEYTLNAADAANPGELPITGDVATATARIASSSFDQSAGTKEFKLATNTVRVSISGTYHGVSGTYYCTPAASSTCAVQVAASGFTLGGTADADNAFTAGGGTWTFKPGSPTAKVTSANDMHYASYGWWLHKAENGTWTASAFVDDKDDGADTTNVPAATGITALRGTATYMGGAAGKYALYSSTGGTNDAGHFTARATLEADFNADMITGTIDQFIGADGQSRNWSVELKKSAIGDTGLIRRSDDDNSDLAATDPGAMTAWTIDGTAAGDNGAWSGSLQANGDDGVPAIGTGTFYSRYSSSGRMVGAFGVNKQ